MGSTTMAIITQKTAAVKWAEKKNLSNRLSRKMKAAGFEKRGANMANCGDIIGLKVCPDCGHAHVATAQLCRDKLCPTCAWRLSLKRYAEMCKTFEALGNTENLLPLFWTLTVRNCKPDKLAETLTAMSEDWNRLMQRRTLKPLFKGWARSVEVTYNKQADTFHPHYHVIVLVDRSYLDLVCPANSDERQIAETRRMLSQAWKEAARLDYEPITDIRAITSKSPLDPSTDGTDDITAAVLETFKYSVKASTLDQMPLESFRHLVNGLAGKRMAAYGGCIKAARRLMCLSDADSLTAADNSLEGESALPCTHCGSAEMKLLIFKWAATEEQYKEVVERTGNIQ